jgi:hypothetical protein
MESCYIMQWEQVSSGVEGLCQITTMIVCPFFQTAGQNDATPCTCKMKQLGTLVASLAISIPGSVCGIRLVGSRTSEWFGLISLARSGARSYQSTSRCQPALYQSRLGAFALTAHQVEKGQERFYREISTGIMI